jgi:hypothetical protein
MENAANCDLAGLHNVCNREVCRDGLRMAVLANRETDLGAERAKARIESIFSVSWDGRRIVVG